MPRSVVCDSHAHGERLGQENPRPRLASIFCVQLREGTCSVPDRPLPESEGCAPFAPITQGLKYEVNLPSGSLDSFTVWQTTGTAPPWSYYFVHKKMRTGVGRASHPHYGSCKTFFDSNHGSVVVIDGDTEEQTVFPDRGISSSFWEFLPIELILVCLFWHVS